MRGKRLGIAAQCRLYERVSYDAALELCAGNHTEAAQVLGMSRRASYRMAPQNREPLETGPTLVQNGFKDRDATPIVKTQPRARQAAKRRNGWSLDDLDPDAVEIARALQESVLRNIPGCALAFATVAMREAKLLRWAMDISKLAHLDLIPYPAIKFLAEWSQRNKSWRGRIVSGKALRDHWNELQEQYESQRRSFSERRRAG